MASKYRTEQQVETAQQKAVRYPSDVLQDADLADELEDLTPEEYADRKGLVITDNPQRRINMANGDGPTNAELQDCIDQATDILTDAYTPEASREELAEAIGAALDALSGDYDEDEDGDDADDEASA